MKRIRGGSGLGDSLYVRAAAEHFLRHGEEVTACSNYPDVFLGSAARVEPFSRDRIDVVAHYASPIAKANRSTNQWQDVCSTARIPEISYQFPWQVRNEALVADLEVRAEGRPIVLVHAGRTPMDRTDGFGRELLPRRTSFDRALEACSGAFLVNVGKGRREYEVRVDHHFSGESVADMMDAFWVCDGVVAQCCFAVPMAEAFGRPLLAVWARAGLDSRTPYIAAVSPAKVFSSPDSRFVVDDFSVHEIEKTAFGWYQKSLALKEAA